MVTASHHHHPLQLLESTRGTGGVLTPEEMARAKRLQDENATLHESNTLLRSENGRMRREVEELRKGLAGLQQEREPLLRQIRCAGAHEAREARGPGPDVAGRSCLQRVSGECCRVAWCALLTRDPWMR